MNKTRQITEASLFTAILVIFIVGSFYIPFISFLLPLPIIILSVRNEPVNVILSGIIGTLLASILVTFIYGLPNGAFALFVGFPMGLSIKRFESPLKAMSIGILGALVISVIVLISLNLLFGISMDQLIDDVFPSSSEIQSEVDEVMKTYSSTLPVEKQTQLKSSLEGSSQALDNFVRSIKLLAPSMVLIFGAITAGANYFVSIRVLKKFKIAHRPLGTFKTFSYPRHLAYGSAGMLLGAYILGSIGLVDMTTVMMNFIYLFIMIYYIQGLAVGYFFLGKSMPKGIAVIILVAVSLLGFMSYIALVGFMDVMLDMRRLQPKKR